MDEKQLTKLRMVLDLIGVAVAEGRVVVERLVHQHAAPEDRHLRRHERQRVEAPVDHLRRVADLDDVLRAGLLREAVEAALVVLDRGDGVVPVHPTGLLKGDAVQRSVGMVSVAADVVVTGPCLLPAGHVEELLRQPVIAVALAEPPVARSSHHSWPMGV